MSIGLVRGLITAILFAAFIALWFWAWGKQRKPEFEAAARLPFESDAELSRETDRS